MFSKAVLFLKQEEQNMDYKVDIGVFGGSGFYSFLSNVVEIEVDTPYGKPSDKMAITYMQERKNCFFAPPRQGT